MRLAKVLGLAAFVLATACGGLGKQGGWLDDEDGCDAHGCEAKDEPSCPGKEDGCDSPCSQSTCRFAVRRVALPENRGLSDASMNERGTILASLQLLRPCEACGPERMLIYPDGSLARIGAHEASNVNDHDQVAGLSFVWTAGEYSWMPPLVPGAGVFVRDIDNRGIAVGSSDGRAVAWSDGVPTELPPVPGQWSAEAQTLGGDHLIAGQAHLGGLEQGRDSAVVWAPGGRIHLTGIAGRPVRINARNEVLIRSYRVGQRSCVWGLEGSVRYLDPLPGAGPDCSAEVADLNDSGWVVGSSFGRAVLWRDGQPADLNRMLGQAAPATLTIAYAVDNAHRILAASPDGELYLLTPNPGCLGPASPGH